jgi:hypothetical protein
MEPMTGKLISMEMMILWKLISWETNFHYLGINENSLMMKIL